MAATFALVIVAMGAMPVQATAQGRFADVLPAPPPISSLTPASATKPAYGVENQYTVGSFCSDWYLEKNYGDSWPAAAAWWEAQCWSYYPECVPICEVDTPSIITDLYYWDGVKAVFYGEHYGDYYGSNCDYWSDAGTGLWYQFDTRACPWTGPGNAAPFATFSYSCSRLDCSFDGTPSFASDGIVDYQWDFGDGTSGAGATPQHSYALKGSYPLTLTVTDAGGLVAAATTTITTENLRPVAVFAYTCTDKTCAFDGTASYDPDGTIKQYAWNFGDGPWVVGGSTAQHTYAQGGAYDVNFQVMDDQGMTSYASAQTILIPGDLPPTAGFTVACTALRCHLDPSASSDPDGSIIEYDWTFVDQNNAGFGTGQFTPAPLDISLPHDGTWTVTLKVVDNQHVAGTMSQTVTVADLPPTAAFTWSCVALSCSFDGTGSTDMDGAIQSYSWSFGDGSPPVTTPSAQHTYANAGIYTVSLSVTDDAGLSGMASKAVTIVATIPTASFTVTCSGGGCTFDASGSTDIGGTITTYSWTFGDGTTGQGRVVQHAYSVPRTYTVSLTVTDSGGFTAAATKTASAMSLSAAVASVKNQRQVTLSWFGSNAAAFDVYRNGVRITTTSGTSYADTVSKPGAYTYKVCEAGATTMCSNAITVSI